MIVVPIPARERKKAQTEPAMSVPEMKNGNLDIMRAGRMRWVLTL